MSYKVLVKKGDSVFDGNGEILPLQQKVYFYNADGKFTGKFELRDTVRAGLHVAILKVNGTFVNYVNLCEDGSYYINEDGPVEKDALIREMLLEKGINVSGVSSVLSGKAEIFHVRTRNLKNRDKLNPVTISTVITDGKMKYNPISCKPQRGGGFIHVGTQKVSKAGYAFLKVLTVKPDGTKKVKIENLNFWPNCNLDLLLDALLCAMEV